MTFNRRTILLAVLAIAGTTFAILAFYQRPQPLHGYAVFGESGTDQASAVSFVPWNSDAFVPWNSDATESNLPGTTNLGIRAHLIAVGRDIYLDSNGNGQPEPSEQFQNENNSFEMKSLDGRSVYRLTKASVGMSPEYISDDMAQYVLLSVDVLDAAQPDSVKFRQSGKIHVYPEPVDHGWAHFDGPLTIEFIDSNLKLPASGGPAVNLRLAVVTPSVECGTDSAQKKVSSNLTSTTPGLLKPTVTIQFPSEHEEFITQRYDLDQFC